VLVVVQRQVGRKWVTIGEVTVKAAAAGKHQLVLPQAIATKLIHRGHYRAVAAAADAGGWSKPRAASLALVRRSSKHGRAHRSH
jgi:hypothetical protein